MTDFGDDSVEGRRWGIVLGLGRRSAGGNRYLVDKALLEKVAGNICGLCCREANI